MDFKQNLNVLKEFFAFSIDILDYCEDLIQIRKKVFADKISKATLAATYCVQVAMNSDDRVKCITALKKAERDLGNTIHWLKLCNKAPSYTEKQRNDLFHTGTRLREYCKEKVKDYVR